MCIECVCVWWGGGGVKGEGVGTKVRIEVFLSIGGVC